MAADRRVLILRAVVLTAGYVPWVFGYMLLAFALAYASPWITVPIAWSYLALYGGLCYAWLPGTERMRMLVALAVPLPAVGYIVLAEFRASGDLNAALSWLWILPLQAAGAFAAALLLRRGSRERRDAESL
jgi:hypothetical protein